MRQPGGGRLGAGHPSAGLLHRAFSIFMVDARGRILLQPPRKYHSGGLWANSCCGHPRPGERTVTAARRRLDEELGVAKSRCPVRILRPLPGRARPWDAGERARVYVFGRLQSQPQPDPAEVADLEFLTLREIDRRIKKTGLVAYWMKHHIRHHHGEIARRRRGSTGATGRPHSQGMTRNRNTGRRDHEPSNSAAGCAALCM